MHVNEDGAQIGAHGIMTVRMSLGAPLRLQTPPVRAAGADSGCTCGSVSPSIVITDECSSMKFKDMKEGVKRHLGRVCHSPFGKVSATCHPQHDFVLKLLVGSQSRSPDVTMNDDAYGVELVRNAQQHDFVSVAERLELGLERPEKMRGI